MPSSPKPTESGRRRNRSRAICLGVMAVVVVAAVIIVILSLTVFKPKRPVTTIDAVSLADMDVSLNVAKLAVDLNVTLDVDLSVRNPNKVGFKYADSTAFLNYRGQTVGEASIPAGGISSDETKPMNLTLTVMADRLLSTSQIYSDVLAGTVPFNARTRISGKVSILGVVKVHVVSTTSCDFNVFVSNRSVGGQTCQYKTKL
ncbi:uncharacterized protein LOC107431396 [Ziziphus jujuba]|uniref:Uncharacterized protein LOC107431396 n=2 Tax=Ziziphus jujuba TaxID=326968 RepID=A0A6P4BFF5_ZIZJJ|nr:uncharacterized protein LOC107431396 [Ziziphus jujuba]KAH7515143.1 hypothetical protein FEM48_Zijuj11G0164600 [Ziziphus jujuba var. spinosa]